MAGDSIGDPSLDVAESDCFIEVSGETDVAVVTKFTRFFNVLANEFVAGLSNI